MPEERTITKAEVLKQNYVKPGSAGHMRILEAGYQMTKVDAELIISEWDKDHQSWPLDEVKKARAFLAASKATPEVISTEPGWKRQKPGY